jgi:hypothetical protein
MNTTQITRNNTSVKRSFCCVVLVACPVEVTHHIVPIGSATTNNERVKSAENAANRQQRGVAARWSDQSKLAAIACAAPVTGARTMLISGVTET